MPHRPPRHGALLVMGALTLAATVGVLTVRRPAPFRAQVVGDVDVVCGCPCEQRDADACADDKDHVLFSLRLENPWGTCTNYCDVGDGSSSSSSKKTSSSSSSSTSVSKSSSTSSTSKSKSSKSSKSKSSKSRSSKSSKSTSSPSSSSSSTVHLACDRRLLPSVPVMCSIHTKSDDPRFVTTFFVPPFTSTSCADTCKQIRDTGLCCRKRMPGEPDCPVLRIGECEATGRGITIPFSLHSDECLAYVAAGACEF